MASRTAAAVPTPSGRSPLRPARCPPREWQHHGRGALTGERTPGHRAPPPHGYRGRGYATGATAQGAAGAGARAYKRTAQRPLVDPTCTLTPTVSHLAPASCATRRSVIALRRGEVSPPRTAAYRRIPPHTAVRESHANRRGRATPRAPRRRSGPQREGRESRAPHAVAHSAFRTTSCSRPMGRGQGSDPLADRPVRQRRT